MILCVKPMTHDHKHNDNMLASYDLHYQDEKEIYVKSYFSNIRLSTKAHHIKRLDI